MNPKQPLRIADIGGGTGASALMLAEKRNVQVASVDVRQPFLDAFKLRAADGPCDWHGSDTLKVKLARQFLLIVMLAETVIWQQKPGQHCRHGLAENNDKADIPLNWINDPGYALSIRIDVPPFFLGPYQTDALSTKTKSVVRR